MYDKLFKNNAPQPLSIPLIAVCGDSGIVTRIARRRGYASGLDDVQMAEAERIYNWARSLFVGQDITFFQSHNGVAPSPMHVPHLMPGSNMPSPEVIAELFQPGKSETLGTRFYSFTGDVNALKDKGARYAILEDIDPHAIAEAMLTTPGILDLLLSPPQTKIDLEFTFNADSIIDDLEKWTKLIGTPPEWADGIPVKPFPNRSVYMKDWDAAHNARWADDVLRVRGRFWYMHNRDNVNPPAMFECVGFHGCSGHAHVEMRDLRTGDVTEYVYLDIGEWQKRFIEVDERTARAPLSPQSSVGPYASGGYTSEKPSGVPARVSSRFYRPVGRLTFPDMLKREQEQAVERIELRAEKDSRGNPLFSPELLDERDAAQPVIDATQQMLDYVPFKGTEAPPKEGEKYQRVGQDGVFTVKAVVLEDFGLHKILMEKDDGSLRAKVAFRNHAQWLAHWRPVDSEGNAKPVEFVDLEDFVDAALEGDDDKAAFAEVREGILQEDGNAVRWIRVIGRELDRRVPGWRDYDPPGVLYDDCALIIRAIRTLFRGGVQAEQELLEAQKQIKAQLQMAEHHNKKMSQMEHRMRHLEDLRREVVADAARMFRDIHGRAALVEEMKGSKITTLNEAEPGVASNFIRRLRERSGELMP